MDLDDDELKATRRMNGSDKNVVCMEEDVKHIEYVLDLYKENGEFGGRYISGNLFEKDFIAIEHLIKAYKELKEENAILKKANNISDNVTINDITNFMNKSLEDFNKEYIPVSLVKEKIEEIDKEIEYQKLYGNVAKREKLETKKEHFLEILEGK